MLTAERQEGVALVTGSTDGLGRGVAERLAAAGLTVHLHGRFAEKLERTRSEIAAATGNERLPTHVADLASLEQVRALAREVESSTEALQVLVSNAGVGRGNPKVTTREVGADGYELRFTVNYLAGFLLIMQLLPLLRRSAPARIVMVSSIAQEPIDFDDPLIENGYTGDRAYEQSKLAQVIFGFELAERLGPDSKVTVTSLHPATLMPTNMVKEQNREPLESLEAGIEATLRLAIGEDVNGLTGKFYDRLVEASANAQAYDPEARRQLWDLSLELTGAPSTL